MPYSDASLREIAEFAEQPVYQSCLAGNAYQLSQGKLCTTQLSRKCRLCYSLVNAVPCKCRLWLKCSWLQLTQHNLVLLTPSLPAKNYNHSSSLALICLCSDGTGLLHLPLGQADRLLKPVVTVLASNRDSRSSGLCISGNPKSVCDPGILLFSLFFFLGIREGCLPLLFALELAGALCQLTIFVP